MNAMKQAGSSVSLSVFSLAMLITVAIDSIRNLPAVALFGHALIFFLVLAALFFLVPTALVSAELSSVWKEEGGIYHWVRMAWGEKAAFLAIWLQWINTVIWYPTMLTFIAGTAAFLLNPVLAGNKLYLISVTVGIFWTLTIVNLKGLKTSSNLASFCAVVGMIVPMALIIVLAAIWVLSGKPMQLQVTSHNLMPQWGQTESWLSLTAIIAAFLGMELATVHIRNIRGAQHKFPKALFISVLVILVTMILGSLAIAVVLPASQINLVDGVMQAFSQFFLVYHLSGLTPILAIMLLIGSAGGMVNWIISPAKGLMQAAEHGYLPPFFSKQNQQGVPARLLIVQAVLVTLICSSFFLLPTVNGAYWFLTDLSTQLYVFMYLMMFFVALCIHYKFQGSKYFVIPGAAMGKWVVCLLGIIGCVVTIIVGFVPPAGINVGGPLHYEMLFVSGMIIMLLPVPLLYLYTHIKRQAGSSF